MMTFMLICTFLVVGFAINGLSELAGSSFLNKFLDGNLIVLLVALFSINTTTVSLILTKMREIADKYPSADFTKTRKAMKRATIEQVFLIGLGVIFEIIKSSPWMIRNVPYSEFILNSMLAGIFGYAIQIVYDTAKGVYVILDYGH